MKRCRYRLKPSDFIPETVPEWQHAERIALEELIGIHAQNFTGHKHILCALKRFALAPDNKYTNRALCLTGGAGSGKSAVFAILCKRLRKENILLLANMAGAGPRSREVNSTIERFVAELCHFLKIRNSLPEHYSPELLDNYFRTLLYKSGEKKRVVVLMDGLDQMEKSYRNMYTTWLPFRWPNNCRLICFSLPCAQSRNLLEKNYAFEVSLPLLTPENARTIATRIIRKEHRETNPGVLQYILNKKLDNGTYAFSNPLWLTIAFEVLCISDTDAIASAENLPSAPEDLFSYICKRAEKLFGEVFTRSVLSLLAINRNGWCEHDLVELVPLLTGESWNRLTFNAFKHFFRSHLLISRLSQKFSFSNVKMVQAVKVRYLPNNSAANQLHSLVADYLQKLPDSDQRRMEIMSHLLALPFGNALAEYYCSDMSEPELNAATHTLAEYISTLDNKSVFDKIEKVLDLINFGPQNMKRLVERLQYDLADRLEYAILSGEKEHFHLVLKEHIKEMAGHNPYSAEWLRALAISHERLGNLYASLGFPAEAQTEYESSADLVKKLVLREPENTAWQRDLLVTCEKLGDIYKALDIKAKALNACLAAADIAQRLAADDPERSDWQEDLIISLDKTGDVYTAMRLYTEALAAYDSAGGIARKMLEKEADSQFFIWYLCINCTRVGDIQSIKGNLSESQRAYEESLDIMRALARVEPANTVLLKELTVAYENLGDIFSIQDKFREAQQVYTASLELGEKLAAMDPGNTELEMQLKTTYKKLGEVNNNINKIFRK
jgi:tetratricopeptide (TPR) repeat protein